MTPFEDATSYPLNHRPIFGAPVPLAVPFVLGGAILWAWEADPEFEEAAGEQWLVLLPKKWNKQQQYSWRFDPRELGAAPNAQQPARPANLRRCED